ncbi:hypothetical protein D3C79_1041690 [compost metagenome]
MMKPRMNMGMAMSRRFINGFWVIFRKSATIRRALRNAVSPEVMGRITTPRMARMPPTVPSRLVETSCTTAAGPPLARVALSASVLS